MVKKWLIENLREKIETQNHKRKKGVEETFKNLQKMIVDSKYESNFSGLSMSLLIINHSEIVEWSIGDTGLIILC